MSTINAFAVYFCLFVFNRGNIVFQWAPNEEAMSVYLPVFSSHSRCMMSWRGYCDLLMFACSLLLLLWNLSVMLLLLLMLLGMWLHVSGLATPWLTLLVHRGPVMVTAAMTPRPWTSTIMCSLEKCKDTVYILVIKETHYCPGHVPDWSGVNHWLFIV